MKGMMRLFLPDQAVARYDRLDLRTLQKAGIRLLFCDVDNTLCDVTSGGCSREAAAFLVSLKRAQIIPVLFTNNTRAHFERVFAGHPDCASVTFCCKPLPFSIRQVLRAYGLRPSQAAILGDQLYTDMLAGHLAGIRTILCMPLSTQERPDTKLMRRLEEPLYRSMERRGFLKREEHDVRIL